MLGSLPVIFIVTGNRTWFHAAVLSDEDECMIISAMDDVLSTGQIPCGHDAYSSPLSPTL